MTTVNNLYIINNDILVYRLTDGLRLYFEPDIEKLKIVTVEKLNDFQIDSTGGKLMVFILSSMETKQNTVLIYQENNINKVIQVFPSYQLRMPHTISKIQILDNQNSLKELSDNQKILLSKLEREYFNKPIDYSFTGRILKIKNPLLIGKYSNPEFNNKKLNSFTSSEIFELLYIGWQVEDEIRRFAIDQITKVFNIDIPDIISYSTYDLFLIFFKLKLQKQFSMDINIPIPPEETIFIYDRVNSSPLSEISINELMSLAIEKDYLFLLIWLYTNYKVYPQGERIDFITLNGYLDILQWIYNLPTPEKLIPSLQTRNLAAQNNQDEIVAWIDSLPEYQIKEVKKLSPPKQIDVPKPRNVLGEQMAGLCSTIILNPSNPISANNFNKLVRYTDKLGYGKLEDNVRSKRIICDKVLRDIIKEDNPSMNIDRLNDQNLARYYQNFQQTKLNQAREQKIIQDQEREQQRKQNYLIKLNQARENSINDRIANIRRTLSLKSVCVKSGLLVKKFSDYNIVINEELQGRRVFLPQKQWSEIYGSQTGEEVNPVQQRDQLIENEIIRTALEDILGDNLPDYDLSDQRIIDIIGEDIINIMIPGGLQAYLENKQMESQTQIYLKIDTYEPICSIIVGYHNDGDNILYMSKQLFEEQKKVKNIHTTKIIDCSLFPIGMLDVELLRYPELDNVNTDEEYLKNLFINKIEEYGVLTVGDLLSISVDNVNFRYLVENIYDTQNSKVYAAGIPGTSQNIKVKLHIQSKDESREMIADRFFLDIDEQYI